MIEAMSGTMTQLVLVCWGALAIILTLMWWRQLRTEDATSVDVVWSFGLVGCAVVYATFGEGDPDRRALVGTLAALWGMRLGTFLLANRVLGHAGEDGRYAALRAHWGDRAPKRFFFVYQAQAAVAVLFSVPIAAAMLGGPPGSGAVPGILIWIVAVGGEAIADRQLARFRDDPENRGKVCREGLWRYSRHPNYFFEWVHWFSYVVIGGGALLTWVGPVFMLLFLFRVSGIPYTEMQALKSRGDAYREYQETTSVFLPWFPSRGGAE